MSTGRSTMTTSEKESSRPLLISLSAPVGPSNYNTHFHTARHRHHNESWRGPARLSFFRPLVRAREEGVRTDIAPVITSSLVVIHRNASLERGGRIIQFHANKPSRSIQGCSFVPVLYFKGPLSSNAHPSKGQKSNALRRSVHLTQR